MRLRRVMTQNFRNYESLEMEPAPGVNILRGANAQGKTSFIEAVYLCATGRSQRTANIRELIMFGCSDAHVRVMVDSAESEARSVIDCIDVHIRRDSGKGIALNGLPLHKIGDLFGTLLAVVFSPEDLGLLKSGPGERRRFMDMELCQLSALYYYELREYCAALKQRNNLLKSSKNNKKLLESVFVWNEQLISHGTKIIAARAGFVKEMSEAAGLIHADISGGECLALKYHPSVAPDEFAKKLENGIDRDLATGTTNFGVHRDDLIFTINGSDARYYGSQGQQRTACLAVKLAEIGLITKRTNKKPVLLLDDVLSELDEARQGYLFKNTPNVQTFITSAGDMRNTIGISGSDAAFKVEAGGIRREM